MTHEDEYHDNIVTMLELVWGDGSLVSFKSQIGFADRLQYFPGTFTVVVKIYGVTDFYINGFSIFRVKQRVAGNK